MPDENDTSDTLTSWFAFSSIIAEYYGDKFKIIHSIEVDDTEHLVKINVLTLEGRKSKMGELIGRKGVIITGLQDKIHEEFGSEWRVELRKIKPNRNWFG